MADWPPSVGFYRRLAPLFLVLLQIGPPSYYYNVIVPSNGRLQLDRHARGAAFCLAPGAGAEGGGDQNGQQGRPEALKAVPRLAPGTIVLVNASRALLGRQQSAQRRLNRLPCLS